LLTLIPTLFISSIASASWAKLSSEALIEQTNVAVVGEFIGTTRISSQEVGKELIVGVIKIESVLVGSIQDDLLLIVIRKAGYPLSSSIINFNKGEKGLWLLKQYSSANSLLYSVNHPQQFIASGDVARINHFKSLLLENKTR
jgi:hypothetical protein